MFDYDDDSDDYGFENDEYDEYGYHGDNMDYGDVMAFHMHMMGMLDDSYDSNESRMLPNSDYFKWEETRMKDSHLLQFRAVVPGVGWREQVRLNSVTGGDWSKIVEMENGRGWLESKLVVGYQDLYNLASKLGSLLTAWRVRMKQCQGDWSKEHIKELLKARKVTRNQTLGGIQDLDDEDIFGVANEDTGLSWWFRQFLGAQETDFSVEDRMRYSVGRGMVVFGTGESLDQLVREVYGVTNLVQNFTIGVLASNLPVSLPYPALLTLSKLILGSGGGTKLGWTDMEDRASQLVESRYINRVYLATLDIYNVIREIMFRHAAETASPNFPNKFTFLRSTLVRNLSLLQSFHQLLTHEEPQADKVFYKELKELKFKMEPSRHPDIVLQKKMARDRVVVSGDHIFTVQFKGRRQDMEAGLIVAVHLLETGEVVQEFTAVSLSLLSGEKYTLCTQVCVYGDLVAISLSQGYPKTSSLSSSDHVFVINWVEEKLLMSKKISHSPQVIGAVREMRAEYLQHSGSDDDNDSLNSSFYDDDMVNSSLSVSLTEKDGTTFLLHSEVVLPEMEYKAEVDKWGQHVRIWELHNNKMLQELNDVRVLDLQDGMVIYEEPKDGRSKDDKKEKKFIQFNDIDVVVKWLDLVSGKELFQEIFVDTKQTPRPVYSIARQEKRETMVLQYQPGEDVVSIYKVNEVGLVDFWQEIAFPALTSVGCKNPELKMQLLSMSLLSFSHCCISPSLESSLPVNLTRCVLAKAGSDELICEVFVPNAMDYDEENKTYGYHMVNQADRIIQEGYRLVIMRSKEVENDRESTVSVQQYEFQKSALEVITLDVDVANDIIEKMEFAKKESKRLLAKNDTVLDVLAMEGKRQEGSLVNWCGSFGFLKLHAYPNAPNVFIHISEISKPRPFLTAGIKMEVRLQKDFTKNKVNAVAGRVLYY